MPTVIFQEADRRPLSALNGSLNEFVNQLIARAITQQASDIHCEPFQQHYQIRFRMDGQLREVGRYPINLADQLTARIKIMANLDIAEKRLPQDGGCLYQQINLRISTCPTQYGEKIVLRLLNPNKQIRTLAELGLTPSQQQRILKILTKPQGLILITGPTGSGKTMSLYSILQYLNQDDKSIMTIEEPIEIQLEGINQASVNRKIGFDFSKALRAFLRQDPDIMMLGEIRDHETAHIAMRAAQTGHLVLTTLHCRHSFSAIERLTQMGIPIDQIFHHVSLITAQRLLKKLCPHCKLPDNCPDDLIKQNAIKRPIKLYRPNGCPHCHTGFLGRVAVHEILPLADAMLITQNLKRPKLSLELRARQLAISGEIPLDETQRLP